MFGCLRKLGCLVVIVGAGAGYYWYTHHRTESPPEASLAGTWLPVTKAAAQRGTSAVAGLDVTGNRPYATMNAAEAAGYLVQHAAAGFPAAAEGMRAMITGDTLHVRSVLDLNAIGGTHVLGPLASMLSGRDTVQLSARAELIKPGLAQLRVTNVRVHDFNLPHAVIPRVLSQVRGNAPLGVASDAIPLALPASIGDVRIANGKVTVYKNVAQ